ncbi:MULTISPECIES: nickel ABC transporter permease [unclassified Shinella]|uniref:nickel ABC transporter permease n=1 Tax=unclassified Shinella TaxID=2643062 RepID=UPI00234EB5A6|nr:MULTISPECIES: nickel ABC transporter permease [unclassified Shinella]MCO5151659.1 ABC transporter permease [Shinella sp.]MDC7266334.1 ABC transporter permease [Shinella sp. HY16]MDC7273231.1 ABC transporter permease [Shinella sp. YZ44]
MLAYAVKRAFAGLSVLLGITVVIFLMLRFIPGDPATAVLLTMVEPGLDSAQITQGDIQQMREQMGLNDPLPEQYVKWLGRVVSGNLGTSLRSRQPIVDELSVRLPATLALAGTSLLVMFVIALPSGILGGLYAGRPVDHVTRFLSLIGESMPSFFLGVLLIYLFTIELGWLPALGWQRPESIILPALTLGTGIAAATSRLLRASLLDTLSQPYMLMAEAKGMPRGILLFRHALRPALIPVLTSASLVAGGLLGGAAVVETVFAWPGIGRYVIEAISGRDYPVVQGFTLIMATMFVIINFTVDMLYRFLDPRVRVEEGNHG